MTATTDRRLGVLQICADGGIAPGGTKGASAHLRGVAAGLAEAGHDLTTCTRRAPEGPFPTPWRPLDELGTLGEAIDVVYERMSLGHLDGMAAARRLGVPFVLEVNAPLVDEAEAHRPGTVSDTDRAVEDELLAGADLVVVVSSVLGDWARSRGARRVEVLPNGHEPDWFRLRPDHHNPRHALVFCGHPKPWHGADRLVELLVELQRRGPRPGLLVVGGGSGADELAALAARAGVADQLTITGALAPNVAATALARASIGLAPYRRQEPFYFCPLKVLDYQAAGLAVVSTAQGDLPSLIGDGGLVVDPDDDAALVDAVHALLDDPDRRAAMGAVGRARSAERTWAEVARRTLAAIAGLPASVTA